MVKVRLRGILVDETGVEEIELKINDLQELLYRLEKSLPDAWKILINSRPRSYVCIVINGSALNNMDPTQFSSIKLRENDVVEFIPIASGG